MHLREDKPKKTSSGPPKQHAQHQSYAGPSSRPPPPREAPKQAAAATPVKVAAPVKPAPTGNVIYTALATLTSELDVEAGELEDLRRELGERCAAHVNLLACSPCSPLRLQPPVRQACACPSLQAGGCALAGCHHGAHKWRGFVSVFAGWGPALPQHHAGQAASAGGGGSSRPGARGQAPGGCAICPPGVDNNVKYDAGYALYHHWP